MEPLARTADFSLSLDTPRETPRGARSVLVRKALRPIGTPQGQSDAPDSPGKRVMAGA